jgi:hypothetical protein
MQAQLDILRKLADELAAARRWPEAKAVQDAMMHMQAALVPVLNDDVCEADYRAVIGR